MRYTADLINSSGSRASQVAPVITHLPVQKYRKCGFSPWVRRSPGRGHGNSLQYLPGESHGQRSLPGYSPLRAVLKSYVLKRLSTHTVVLESPPEITVSRQELGVTLRKRIFWEEIPLGGFILITGQR